MTNTTATHESDPHLEEPVPPNRFAAEPRPRTNGRLSFLADQRSAARDAHRQQLVSPQPIIGAELVAGSGCRRAGASTAQQKPAGGRAGGGQAGDNPGAH